MCHTRDKHQCTYKVIKNVVRGYITKNTFQKTNTKKTNDWIVEILCSGHQQHNDHDSKSRSFNKERYKNNKKIKVSTSLITAQMFWK